MSNSEVRMRVRHPRLVFAVFALLLAFAGGSPVSTFAAEGLEAPPAELPVKGMVTLVDLGAKTCIPCKMMAPILEELEAEYRGRARIAFIDVYKHREQVERFGIRSIPTQVFFDKDGKEVSRHVGFMDKAAIAAELKKLGVQ